MKTINDLIDEKLKYSESISRQMVHEIVDEYFKQLYRKDELKTYYTIETRYKLDEVKRSYWMRGFNKRIYTTLETAEIALKEFQNSRYTHWEHRIIELKPTRIIT